MNLSPLDARVMQLASVVHVLLALYVGLGGWRWACVCGLGATFLLGVAVARWERRRDVAPEANSAETPDAPELPNDCPFCSGRWGVTPCGPSHSLPACHTFARAPDGETFMRLVQRQRTLH